MNATTSSPEPAEAQGNRPDQFHVFVGTYTQRGSKGIYRMTLDLKTGRLSEPEVAAEVSSPSFLAVHPDRTHLYAVSEINDFQGKKTGGVTAFKLDPRSGKLTQLNQQPSQGQGPCHVSVDRSGRTVLVANYGSGSIASYPVAGDGSLKDAASAIQHVGGSVNKQRQEGPHAHSINTDPDGKYAFAADLGLDKVMIYRLDAAAGKLTPNRTPSVSVTPGSGPRHFAFHPSGKWAYVINEMVCTVTAFAFDSKAGSLTEIQTITTLPGAFERGFSTAEVQVHPSGRFLYGSNRGHHSIAGFRIDSETGKLTAIGHTPSGGKTPRNFGIDPTGQFLLAANQDSDDIFVYRINRETGALTATGQSVKVAMPVCVRFAAVEK